MRVRTHLEGVPRVLISDVPSSDVVSCNPTLDQVMREVVGQKVGWRTRESLRR